jgi:hypothetical protein
MDAFTGEVNRILQTEAATWAGPKILLEIRKRIDASTRDALKKAKDAQAAKAAPAKLRDVPAADDHATEAEFACLDRLNDAEYEEAVSKSSPEQLKRYEAQH